MSDVSSEIPQARQDELGKMVKRVDSLEGKPVAERTRVKVERAVRDQMSLRRRDALREEKVKIV